MQKKAFQGSVFHILHNPWEHDMDECYEYIEDGVIIVDENGLIEKTGTAKMLMPEIESLNIELTRFENAIIMPGLIDNHIHFPQVAAIACYGEQLLQWLHDYIFPVEEALKDKRTALKRADFFIRELFRNGTTTAAAFCSIHAESVDALFETAQQYNMRLIAGKCLMDRNGPEDFASYDTVDSALEISQQLIRKWHNHGRFSYALTPRFGPSCTGELLEVVSKLKNETPDIYCQTHICENEDEIKWVLDLFPNCKSYMDLWDQYNILGPRTLLGHALHMNEDDFIKAAETGTILCPAPPSNFFLGSGFYNFELAKKHNVRTALATDMGAGNTFSMFNAMEQAYKMAQLQHYALSPIEAYYLATLGNARAISADHKIGNFEQGKEADFIVLDLNATPIIEYRLGFSKTLMDKLFVLMMLGDDRLIDATYIMGKCVYSKNA